MTTNKKPPVPYAERLARESVKFGLRVGGSFLRHGPGLLRAGVFGLPLLLMGMAASHDSDEGVADDNDLGEVPPRTFLEVPVWDDPNYVQNEYHHTEWLDGR